MENWNVVGVLLISFSNLNSSPEKYFPCWSQKTVFTAMYDEKERKYGV